MIWEFLQEGGPVMAPLALCSVVSLALILDRWWALRRNRVAPSALVRALMDTEIGLEEIRSMTATRRGTLVRLLKTADRQVDRPYEENAHGLELRARRETTRLDRGLVGLEIIVGIAPLLGLAGTIHGLMALFGGIGDLGQADGATLARGIGIALNTTFLGLLIAIPSLVAWNTFEKRVENLSVEMENACVEYLRRLYPRSAAEGRE